MALEKELPTRARGAALFADISGFTPLTGALLNELGPQRGPEEVTRYLNTVFDRLITRLDCYSGSTIVFSGDAITCWFDGDNGLRAVACAVEMQETIQQFGEIITPSGKKVVLAMKVGIAAGQVRRFLVGDPGVRVFDILAGRTLDRLAAAEHHAVKGDIVLSSEVVDALGDQIEIKEWREDPHPLSSPPLPLAGEGPGVSVSSSPSLQGRGRGLGLLGEDPAVSENNQRFGVLKRLLVSVATQPWGYLPLEAITEEQIRPWLIPSIYERLNSGQGEFLGELRPGVPMFIYFTGIDYDYDEDCMVKLDTFIRRAVQILANYDGSIFAIIMGDKGSYLYTVMGAPVAHEDDPARAANVALEIRAMVQELGYIEGLRIGITHGWLYAGAGGGVTRRTYVAIGDEVNLSARLMQAAQANQILIASHVWYPIQYAFMAEALPPMRVKGKTAPISVYSLDGVKERNAAILRETGGYGLPMVGRQEELKKFERELELVTRGRGQIFGITGEAGMGKSRLAVELMRLAIHHKMAIYGGECEAYGVNHNYLVWQGIWHSLFELHTERNREEQIRELEEQLTRIDPALLPRLPLLGAVLKLPIPDNALTQAFDAKLRKSSLEALLVDCLRAKARQRPLVIILEDCQWMDELSHDLLGVIGRAIINMPVLLMLTYRPAARVTSQLGGGQFQVSGLPNFMEVKLSELSLQETEQFISLKLQQLSKTPALISPALVSRILEKTDGNPFYIEELINYLRDRGVDPSNIQILEQLYLPDSLYSLVLSRIDQFNESQKVTLKVASIIGRMFKAAWIWGYYPQPGDPQLTLANLDTLYQTDLVPVEASEPDPEKSYLFKHITTQEVAYESLPYNTRSKLHGMFAGFIESTNIGLLDRYTDVLAFHYGNSENVAKKREYWLKAGQDAQAKHANSAAIEFYRRVLPLLEMAEKTDVYQRLGQVLELMGKWSEAGESYQQALELYGQLNDIRGQAMVETAMGELHRKQGQYDEAEKWLDRARAVFEALQDRDGIARVLHYSGTVAAHRSKLEQARELYQRSLEIRRELNDKPRTASLLSNLGIVARAQGNLELARALNEEALALRREVGDRWAIGVSVNNLGNVAADQGRFAEARALHQEGLAIRREVGDRWAIANALNNLGNLARDQGDHIEAARFYQESLEINQELDDKLAIAYLLEDIACLSVLRHSSAEYERAFCLVGAAGSLRKKIGASLWPSDQKKLESKLEAARAALGEEKRAQLLAQGEQMGLQEMIEYAAPPPSSLPPLPFREGAGG